jgi:hypothetical protein
MPVQNRIQVRRGTAGSGSYQWTTQVLYAGEIGYETDTGKFKIGDGSTIWSSLPYAAVSPSDLTESVQDIIGSSLVGVSGVNISYNDTSGNTTISLNSPTVQASDVTGLNEAIDDRTNDLLVAGSNIQLSYNDSANTLTVAVTGVSLSGHNHTASNITDFNSAVSGLLPVVNVNVNGSGYVNVSNSSGNFIISVTGLQPSGNYSVSGHTHTLSQGATDVTATASEVNYLDLTSGPGTGEASKAVVLDSNKDFTGIRNLTLSGDLTVNGTTTTINSTIVNVDDKNLELGSVNSPTDTTADGGGITLKGTSDKEFKWVNSTTSWTSSENINLNSSSLTYKLNGTTVIGNNILGASGYSLASGIVIDGGTP